MGLFDIFKKKPKALPQPAKVRPEDEEKVAILKVNYTNSFRHGDGTETDLYIARMNRTDETIFLEDTDYVAFEIPRGIKLNEEIMGIIKNRYERESRRCDTKNNQYYFGRLQQIGEEMYFGKRSNAVNSYIQQIVSNEINARSRENQQREAERQKERQREEEQRRFKDELDARRYLQKISDERERRKANPELKRSGVQQENGERNIDYSGINVNTGEILRIMNTSKIGKDATGTYLYTARIYNTQNTEDADMLGIGYNVCFELNRRLEDIVDANNPEEKKKVLELLSYKENFQDMKENLMKMGRLVEGKHQIQFLLQTE